jgi:hypothetical protein
MAASIVRASWLSCHHHTIQRDSGTKHVVTSTLWRLTPLLSVASRWVLAAPALRPVAQLAGPNNKQWRMIGPLNALTGQVDYLDAYTVVWAKVIAFYRQLVQAYPNPRRIYVVQDDWLIHTHKELLAALDGMPQIERVWLPTLRPGSTQSRSCGAG